jgi:hypothetical protein
VLFCVTIVPVLSGKVSVRFVEVAGLSIVKVAVPVAAPAMEIFDICYSCAACRSGSKSSVVQKSFASMIFK